MLATSAAEHARLAGFFFFVLLESALVRNIIVTGHVALYLHAITATVKHFFEYAKTYTTVLQKSMPWQNMIPVTVMKTVYRPPQSGILHWY